MDAGIEESWIREHRGSSATAEGIIQWREFIEVANQNPTPHFCGVVRCEAEIVGYLCGHWEDSESITLGPMYLLDHAQGLGLGGRMMTEFLAWAGHARSASTGATASRSPVSLTYGEGSCPQYS
ncbi:GNAT family N-acetyltransferase [Streptomyces sp. NPDC001835]|uniref:GNAT family N-acetyltransferase n=1 Tax=Streptomyces sp. NPDC001835 TaxID=3154528 RepID=UPI003331C0BB